MKGPKIAALVILVLAGWKVLDILFAVRDLVTGR